MKKTRFSIVLMSLLTLSIVTLGFSAWLLPGSLEGFNQNITIEVGNIKDLSYIEITSAESFIFSDTSFIENYNPDTGLGTRVDVGNIDVKMNLDYSKINVTARSKLVIDLRYKFSKETSVFDFSSMTAFDEKGNYFTYNEIKNYGVKLAPSHNKISYEFLLDSSLINKVKYDIKLPFIFNEHFAKSLLDISFLIEPRVEGIVA